MGRGGHPRAGLAPSRRREAAARQDGVARRSSQPLSSARGEPRKPNLLADTRPPGREQTSRGAAVGWFARPLVSGELKEGNQDSGPQQAPRSRGASRSALGGAPVGPGEQQQVGNGAVGKATCAGTGRKPAWPLKRGGKEFHLKPAASWCAQLSKLGWRQIWLSGGPCRAGGRAVQRGQSLGGRDPLPGVLCRADSRVPEV